MILMLCVFSLAINIYPSILNILQHCSVNGVLDKQLPSDKVKPAYPSVTSISALMLLGQRLNCFKLKAG